MSKLSPFVRLPLERGPGEPRGNMLYCDGDQGVTLEAKGDVTHASVCCRPDRHRELESGWQELHLAPKS